MGEIDNQMKSVSLTRMADGTAEEYAFLTPLYEKCRNGVSDRLLELLKAMKGDKLGYQVDRYTHSLQSATRAESDGADEETVVCALLHDLGDVIAPDNHSEVIASILRPYISEKNHWVLKHHGLFQGFLDPELCESVSIPKTVCVWNVFKPADGVLFFPGL